MWVESIVFSEVVQVCYLPESRLLRQLRRSERFGGAETSANAVLRKCSLPALRRCLLPLQAASANRTQRPTQNHLRLIDEGRRNAFQPTTPALGLAPTDQWIYEDEAVPSAGSLPPLSKFQRRPVRLFEDALWRLPKGSPTEDHRRSPTNQRIRGPLDSR